MCLDYNKEYFNKLVRPNQAATPSPEEKIIAKNIISRLYNGCCIQLGNRCFHSQWEVLVITHPDFRDEQIQEAEEMKIWKKSNKIPASV